MTRPGLLALLTATVAHAALFVVDRAVLLQNVEPLAYSIARTGMSALIVLGLVVIKRASPLTIFEPSYRRALFIIGLLSVSVGTILHLIGMQSTSATNAGIINAIYAPLAAIFAAIALREKLTRSFWSAMMIMLLGVWVAQDHVDLKILGYGDSLVLLSTVAVSASAVYAQRMMDDLPMPLVALGRLTYGALSLLPFAFMLSSNFSSLNNAPWLVALSAIIFGVRTVAFYYAINLEGAAVASTFMLAAPVITLWLAGVYLDEQATLQTYLALVLLTFGGYHIATKPNRIKG